MAAVAAAATLAGGCSSSVPTVTRTDNVAASEIAINQGDYLIEVLGLYRIDGNAKVLAEGLRSPAGSLTNVSLWTSIVGPTSPDQAGRLQGIGCATAAGWRRHVAGQQGPVKVKKGQTIAVAVVGRGRAPGTSRLQGLRLKLSSGSATKTITVPTSTATVNVVVRGSRPQAGAGAVCRPLT